MMGIRIRDAAGTLRTVTRIRMRDAGGVLRTIQRIRIRDAANVLRTVWQFFNAYPNRIATGTGNTGPSQDITTNGITIIPVGGTAPYTYSWSKVFDPTNRWTINSPGSALTTLTCDDVLVAEFVSLDLECLVTDNVGNTVTVSAHAQVDNVGP